MSAFWSATNLAAILAPLGARWHRPPAPDLPLAPCGLSIDSRAITPGGVFLALRGERLDGHDFLPQAVAGGAAMLIAERPPAQDPGVPVLLVPAARPALAALAAAYRDTLAGACVVAVAGSNGKTTTTRLIAAALAARGPGHRPNRSFNNDIGVPLTILATPADATFLVCEVGSNAAGEVAALARIVRPDIAVIVSIGREHLEGFGSLRGVAAEEAAVADGLRSGGLLVATADSPELADELARRDDAGRGVRTVTFGRAAHADIRLARAEPAPAGQRVLVADGATFALNLLGEHNAVNALAALAITRALALPDDATAAGLAAAREADMRLQRLSVAGVDVLNDAYNANPESTLAALRTFLDLHPRPPAGGARVVVLGDNLEQGTSAAAVHAEIGSALAEHARAGRFERLITVGPLAALAGGVVRAGGLQDVHAVESTAAGGAERLAAWINAGDAVLLKGSRGTRLERTVEALRARTGTPTAAATPRGGGDAVPAL